MMFIAAEASAINLPLRKALSIVLIRTSRIAYIYMCRYELGSRGELYRTYR